jgi:hypothetical protein
MAAFWNITSCTLLEVDRRFRGTYCLNCHPDDGLLSWHFQGMMKEDIRLLECYVGHCPLPNVSLFEIIHDVSGVGRAPLFSINWHSISFDTVSDNGRDRTRYLLISWLVCKEIDHNSNAGLVLQRPGFRLQPLSVT